MDVVIVGGGIAGLWTLDALVARGYDAVLLEADALGAGQTIAAQGIIHGGLKYTLSGLLSPAAEAIREMPGRWRESLDGRANPDLQSATVRADACHLWRTNSLRSRAGMIGARAGLRVAPNVLDRTDRPPVLRECPGDVALIAEQVVDPASILNALASTHRERCLRVDAERTEFETEGRAVAAIRFSAASHRAALRPGAIILAAGAGNDGLRSAIGLSAIMQRRPLHMVVMRGDLPILNGHCVDGAKTRVTITSSTDVAGRVTWQVGGQLAEDGVDLEPGPLLERARHEVAAVLPGLDINAVQWTTYRIDRAEPRVDRLVRPDDAFVRRDENVLTAWPTKLAMAPRLADRVLDLLHPPAPLGAPAHESLRDWPRPDVALPPWEMESTWIDDRSDAPISS